MQLWNCLPILLWNIIANHAVTKDFSHCKPHSDKVQQLNHTVTLLSMQTILWQKIVKNKFDVPAKDLCDNFSKCARTDTM